MFQNCKLLITGCQTNEQCVTSALMKINWAIALRAQQVYIWRPLVQQIWCNTESIQCQAVMLNRLKVQTQIQLYNSDRVSRRPVSVENSWMKNTQTLCGGKNYSRKTASTDTYNGSASKDFWISWRTPTDNNACVKHSEILTQLSYDIGSRNTNTSWCIKINHAKGGGSEDGRTKKS